MRTATSICSYRSFRWPASLALLLSGVWLAGCNDDPLLGEVTGWVTLDGVPLEQATVMFVPDKPGRPSLAVTDVAGHFELRFDAMRYGAIIGRHEVQIFTFQAESQVDDNADDDLDAANATIPERPERLPRRYHARTELSADVKSGATTCYFHLQSDPNDPAPVVADAPPSTDELLPD